MGQMDKRAMLPRLETLLRGGRAEQAIELAASLDLMPDLIRRAGSVYRELERFRKHPAMIRQRNAIDPDSRVDPMCWLLRILDRDHQLFSFNGRPMYGPLTDFEDEELANVLAAVLDEMVRRARQPRSNKTSTQRFLDGVLPAVLAACPLPRSATSVLGRRWCHRHREPRGTTTIELRGGVHFDVDHSRV